MANPLSPPQRRRNPSSWRKKRPPFTPSRLPPLVVSAATPVAHPHPIPSPQGAGGREANFHLRGPVLHPGGRSSRGVGGRRMVEGLNIRLVTPLLAWGQRGKTKICRKLTSECFISGSVALYCIYTLHVLCVCVCTWDEHCVFLRFPPHTSAISK